MADVLMCGGVVSPWIEKSEVMAWPVVVVILRNEANLGNCLATKGARAAGGVH